MSNIVLDIHVFQLNAAFERHVFPKIAPEMVIQSTLVDPLVVITLANIVKHTLHQQTHQIHNHQCPNQEPTNHNPRKQSIILPSMNHHSSKDPVNRPANCQIPKNKHRSHAGPSLQQLIALLHCCKPEKRFKHGDDASQVPQCGDVHVNDQIEKENHNHGEEEQNRVLRIDGYEEQDEKSNKDDVVDNHGERDPEVGDEEALKDAGDGGERGGEGDGLGGVERGDSEDDGGSGEKGEGEEEDEVAELEEEEFGPLGGVLVGGSADLGEERVSEESVGEDCEGEGEN